MPFGALGLQHVIHADRAFLAGAAEREFNRHHGQPQKQQAYQIDQNERAAAILAAHPGKLPNVAAADRASRRKQDEAEAGTQFFSLLQM